MPFRITLRYGDYSISHEDEQDTLAAMQSGVYAAAMRFGTSQMVSMMESSLLSEDPDYDRDAVALFDKEAKEDVRSQPGAEESVPESGSAPDNNLDSGDGGTDTGSSPEGS